MARLESQVADLTRVIEAQQRRREHAEAIQAEHAARLQHESSLVASLRHERDDALLELQNLRHDFDVELRAHESTKLRLTDLITSQERKWSEARLELQKREETWEFEMKQSKIIQQELQQQYETLSCSEGESQEHVRNLEGQLRSLKHEKNELEMNVRTVTVDGEYLARGQTRQRDKEHESVCFECVLAFVLMWLNFSQTPLLSPVFPSLFRVGHRQATI